MKKIKRFLSLLLATLMVVTPPVAYPAFEPVNDDTDIFLANPNVTSQVPNVLIVLDNTANWNTPFVNEKKALVQVVNGLDDGLFNVGLMMMVETGSPNDNVDGGYMRFAVRNMNGANKTALSTMVNNLDILNDKGNNNTVGYALHEAYLYYGGLSSRASGGKFKTDHDATTDPLLAGLPGNHALPGTSGPPAMPVLNSVYRSPIVNGCQKNFIIYISNGQANENAAARAEVEGFLATLTGQSPPAVIGYAPDVPTGQQANWGDEMAKYLANADVSASFPGKQSVFTYAVEVNPQSTGLGPDMTALMKSVATNGKGRYFGVTSSADGTQISDALNAIFNEILAVNSVFASTTLPVSINVRGTNLNQVYIGVFRPDANKAPRWLGNLKMYQFALTTDKQVILADADNQPAVSQGFIAPGARSFWTVNSGPFWGFRDASENGVGGALDTPDGDLVEKGGAAQQVRISYAAAEASSPARNLYTYTNDGFTGACTANCPLSATPFIDANTDITNEQLALDTRFVSPLTAFDTRSVTSLTDRKAAILSNALSPIAVSSLSNGATTRTITNLTTAVPKVVSSLTGLTSTGAQVVSLSTVAKVTGNTYRATAATTSLPGAYVVGATVTISGVSGNNTNGTRTISAVSANTFDFSCAGCGNAPGTGGMASVTGSSESTTATATLPGHGYTNGQSVTISGASPTQFNGTFNITVNDANSFRYTMASPGGNAAGSPTILAAGNTTVATATTSVAHGFSAGQSVTISGATEFGAADGVTDGSSYNGTKTILASPAPTSNTFSYSVGGTALAPNAASPVYAVRGGSTTVTVTTAVNHGFATSPPGTPTVSILNSDIAGYNGTFEITVTALNQFTYVPSATVLPANNSTTVTASSGFSPTVTATVPNHGFAAGDQIVIEGGTEPLHRGTFTIDTVTPPDTFTYTNAQTVAPTGSYTARRFSPNTATATVGSTAGWSTGDLVTIAGATPTAYNGEYPITVINGTTFTYPLGTAPGPNTSTAVTASKKTMTARATSTAHGFSDGSTVTIANATPSAFNGTFPISVPFLADGVTRDPNTFTYAIGSAQGDATGAITATQAGSTSADRTTLVKWVRGEDNAQDENVNASTTDIRASVHGDVLHSRPAVINYNRTANSENDVFVFYGANDGIFHAIKGGKAADPASTLQPGQEAWGFIPSEFFGQFNRMRKNFPIISSTFKKPYFMDGPIGVYTKDANEDGKLGDAGDIVNLYVTAKRGGRFMYALDVNNPVNPVFKWKTDTATTGFGELGQTWSQPTVVPEGFNGYPNPVLIFGGGYDPAVEDIESSLIQSIDTSTGAITTAAGTISRTMGRAIYVVDAITGALVWSAGGPNSSGSYTINVPGMIYAIPSDVTVIKNESGGPINRAYVGDTGGNLWRIDFKGTNLADSTVTRIASIADPSDPPNGQRKFLHAPDVVGLAGFDAVLIGSGDREHPFDIGVDNRFYMFKDKGSDAGPATGTTYLPNGASTTLEPTIVESEMFDATSNCVANPDECLGTPDEVDPKTAQEALGNKSGWYVKLLEGEKVVGGAISVAGKTFFNTNRPKAAAEQDPGTCTSDLGEARAYIVFTADAQPVIENAATGTRADRWQLVERGGYLPTPVHVVVMLDGTPYEAVISGVEVSTPKTAPLSARLRKYWYKEIDK